MNLEIGTGTSTDDFIMIDWSNGPYFMETAVDFLGGMTWVVMGTSQLMSVPYALYAKTSGNGAAPQGPIGNDGADGIGGVTSAGTGISVTGAGTVGSPYVVSATSACSLSIGDTHQGGIIFYLDASACQGLISAPSDQSLGAQWFNGSYLDTRAYGSGLFEGKYNTQMINLAQGGATSAAAICGDLSLGGFNDWYLPSIEELNKMYQNIGQGNALGLGNVGGFAGDYYWSSAESDGIFAWVQDFNDGYQGVSDKDGNNYVLAVRTF